MELNLFSTEFDSPLGKITALAHQNALVLLEFSDRGNLNAEILRLEKIYQSEISVTQNEILKQTEHEITAYFSKQLKTFTIPFELNGTEFQQNVWKYLQTIPYGKSISYKQQAIEMQNLLGIRAIASANGKNKLAIIVPCHRVVGTDGKLTGYAGEIERKQYLLNLESNHQQLNIF